MPYSRSIYLSTVCLPHIALLCKRRIHDACAVRACCTLDHARACLGGRGGAAVGLHGGCSRRVVSTGLESGLTHSLA